VVLIPGPQEVVVHFGPLSNLEDAELLVYLIDEEMDIYIGVQRLAA
jgi:hypothetical protein